MPYAESSILKIMKGGCNCGITGVMKGGAKKQKQKQNQKQMYEISGLGSGFYDLIIQKKEFLLFVFSNLLVQLGISYYLMMNYKGPQINSWIILFASIGILMIMIFVPMPAFMKFLLFCVFSGLLGINLSKITSEASKNEKSSNKDIIHLAILETISVFGVLFLVGGFLLAGGFRFGLGFATFLFYSLLLLILARIVMAFSGTVNMYTIGFSIVGIILFSLYIIYDTNMILRREYYGDFITASMDYYLDIVNLFMNFFNFNNN
jgi:FtsH-binding integral membrane protein